MNYTIGGPPLFQVRICSEWSEFAREYNLEDGDICIFELINRWVLAFNITIYRRRAAKRVSQKDVAENTKLPNESTAIGRAKSLETIWPSFIAKFKHGANKSHYLYMLVYMLSISFPPSIFCLYFSTEVQLKFVRYCYEVLSLNAECTGCPCVKIPSG